MILWQQLSCARRVPALCPVPSPPPQPHLRRGCTSSSAGSGLWEGQCPPPGRFVPWHWSSQAEPASAGSERRPSRCLLAPLSAGVLSLGFLALESFCIGQEISRGDFGRAGRCCNTPASWSLGEAGEGQVLALPQTLWDNLGQGFVLCLSCCKAVPCLPLLCWEICLCSEPGWQGESAGGLHKPRAF